VTRPEIFSSLPVLPVVPLPVPGESLGSWVTAVARTYGMSLAEYLRRLGIPHRRGVAATERTERDLVVRPRPAVIQALQADTGVATPVLLGMTFDGLDRDLEEACHRHHAPCPACDKDAGQPAGRSVRLLSARAAWRVVCPVHLPTPRSDEVAPGIPLAPIDEQLRTILGFLDRAAFDRTAFADLVGKRLAPAITVGAFVRFVHLLNAHLRIRIAGFDTMRDRAEFRIVHCFDRNEGGVPMPLPAAERNTPALSLLLAWQLTIDPPRTLLTGMRTLHPVRHKSMQDIAQVTGLLDLLLEIWPGEILASLVASGSVSRGRQPGNEGHAALAVALTDHRRNAPDHDLILAEAGWNHAALIGLLLSGEFPRRTQRLSQFANVGPFQYRHVAAGLRMASAVQRRRQKVWANRAWDRRAGLQQLLSEPKRPAREKAAASRRPPEARRDPEPPVPPSARIVEAVQVAMAAHGPMPTKPCPRQRRALLRKLSAAATRHLFGADAAKHRAERGFHGNR
jgi:TniQ